jgi:hypothetical protein
MMDVKIEEIRKRLFKLQDKKYSDFQCRLIPTLESTTIIGVRTPELRRYAKELVKQKDIQNFLSFLPHQYFEENQLHAFIISEIKDNKQCLEELNRFLPFVDNWATCDQLSPKVFKKNRSELIDQIKQWVCSDKTYMVRFGIGMLLEHFLDDDFDSIYLEMVSKISSTEYYIRMMIAWYFATALAKQYTKALPYIEEQRLDIWTHNKTIQKAVESRRITLEQKEYLKCLKI